ncbi:MAG: hypothetical protein JWQ90_1531 [Hydrocarboniphaga sp.]|uniref:hypothetical protein n=1 Tax=Hydrocarboniphaga sp. TaxID=2033016 RepID=UPI00261026DE|nr:hypothetical protein [Hydrocarboniphaga sp.]MDB5969081.1 hypothetical protein [Hydrocarboniphaga sp.]
MKPGRGPSADDFGAALKQFQDDYPATEPAGFVVMRFGLTAEHAAVLAALADVSRRTGVTLLRADHHRYHRQLFDNVCVYLHGCAFAISVFEDAEDRGFNPNVALEVGYLQALNKPVLHLKSSSLKQMPTDLQGAPCCRYDPAGIDEVTRASIADWIMQRIRADQADLQAGASMHPLPIVDLRPRQRWQAHLTPALQRVQSLSRRLTGSGIGAIQRTRKSPVPGSNTGPQVPDGLGRPYVFPGSEEDGSRLRLT